MVEGWKTMELSKVIEKIESGLRPKGGVSETSGEIPSLGGENILQDGGLTLISVKKISLEFYNKLTKGKLKYKDVLINKDGANTGKVGIYNISYFKRAAINEHLFLVRGKKNEATQDYLYYLLLSHDSQKQIKNRITGSAQPGLNSSFIKNFYVNIPENIKEQSKIAEIFTKVDEAIKITEKIIAKQEHIKRGLMQDLLTKGIDENENIRSEETHKFKDSQIGRIPKEWDVNSIEGFEIEIVDGDRGKNYPHENELLNGGYCVFLNNKNIKNLGFDFPEVQFITKEKDEKLRKGRLQLNDIVITTRGTVGNIALFTKDCPHEIMRINSGMIILRNYDANFDGKFLVNYWDFNFGRIYSLIRSGSAQPQLPIKDLKLFSLVKPSKNEQVFIINYLDKTDKMIKEEKQKLSKLKHIKAGLMQDLLTGKVRINHLIEREVVA